MFLLAAVPPSRFEISGDASVFVQNLLALEGGPKGDTSATVGKPAAPLALFSAMPQLQCLLLH